MSDIIGSEMTHKIVVPTVNSAASDASLPQSLASAEAMDAEATPVARNIAAKSAGESVIPGMRLKRYAIANARTGEMHSFIKLTA